MQQRWHLIEYQAVYSSKQKREITPFLAPEASFGLGREGGRGEEEREEAEGGIRQGAAVALHLRGV